MVCVEAHISALADHILALEHKAWPPPHTSHLPGNHSHGLQCSSLSAPAHLAAPHDTLLGLDSQIPLIIHKSSDLLSYISIPEPCFSDIYSPRTTPSSSEVSVLAKCLPDSSAPPYS